jgi:hypothetical protein
VRVQVEVQRMDYSIDATASSTGRSKALVVDATGYDMGGIAKFIRDAKALVGGWSHAVLSHYIGWHCSRGPGGTCYAIALW